ncbi:alpha-E domain-containing protein [Glaciimonas sp. CA11.2]|uniref:alpha-E domain-containing protein n=1 Tax=Glaciimonas sp. CA11.2 TaxID=3048601 RepID=UPI002AB502FD|nr:alpha-E domain-containing protein [Glaciimonas sp. CA11.2]MDY7545575.1 alpha-E domain-containing protein [Glaciimonas sp. CA11.2]MEB0161911.1 alpha-E domain-containing protein [Glaciimonas sp. CA11.2]
MLSRTADHLFWMARYTERAENIARMLDVHLQTGMLPQADEDVEQGWRALLGISELQEAYDKRHKTLTPQNVIDFMVRDPANSSSISACLTQARENARAVRGALTTEAWEIQNATWLKMQGYLKTDALDQNPAEFFEWVKHRSHLSRGVTIGTMLKDEAFHFIRLGTFLERADNTARIIDVKFHSANEKQQKQSQSQSQSQDQEQKHEQALEAKTEPQIDFYYWAAILRSVSAFEIYRKVYRDVITPARVADLLILRADMPRSLAACMEEVLNNLKHVSNNVSADTERFAGKLHAELQFGSIDEILEAGLHDYLTVFFERIFELGNRISRDFLVPLAA